MVGFLLFCGLNIISVGIIANRVGLRSLLLLFAFLVLVLALAAPRIWGISRRTLAVHRAANNCKKMFRNVVVIVFKKVVVGMTINVLHMIILILWKRMMAKVLLF